MRMNYRILFALGIFLALGFHQNVFAAGSGGLRDETPDAAAFGEGSAFVGQADTPAAVYYNPAGMNQIQTLSITAGDMAIAPQYDFKSATTGNETTADRKTYNVPDFYAVAPVNDKLSLGLGAGSYWGLGTDWGNNSPLKYATTDATLVNQDYMLAASYKVTSQWSVAASVDNDYSVGNESLALNLSPYSLPDGNLQLKEKSDAWGYRLATMFKINDQNQIGLMYRSRIDHHYEGNLYSGNNPLLSPNPYETKITDNETLPQSVVMGYSFKPTPKWTINMDVEWFDWSQIKNVSINFPNESNAGNLAVLSSLSPVHYNWHDAWSESIGTEYKLTDKFRVRAGYYHHTSVGPDETWNPQVPDMNSHGITAGFGYDINAHLTVNVAYGIALYEPRTIYGITTDPAVNGDYRNVTNFGAASLTYKF